MSPLATFHHAANRFQVPESASGLYEGFRLREPLALHECVGARFDVVLDLEIDSAGSRGRSIEDSEQPANRTLTHAGAPAAMTLPTTAT